MNINNKIFFFNIEFEEISRFVHPNLQSFPGREHYIVSINILSNTKTVRQQQREK